jgi:hypothetical protein
MGNVKTTTKVTGDIRGLSWNEELIAEEPVH